MPATTDVPIVKIEGIAAFATGLQSVTVRRSLNSVGHAQIRVRADDTDAGKAKVEAKLSLSIAVDGGREAVLFAGEVVTVGIELRRMGAELVIDAYDKAHQLMRRAPVKTHLEQKPSDIIRTIVEEAGLTASVADFGAQHDVYHQSGPAGECVAELCRAFGAEWWVEGDTFRVRKRTTSPPASGVSLRAGESLRTFNVRYTAGEQVQNQGVRGWDVASKSAIVGTAVGVTTPLSGGPSSFTPATGRQDARFWSPLVVDVESANVLSAGAASHAGAAVVTGRGECDAEPAIVPGATIAVDGLGPEWNGDYYVTGVEHLVGIDQPFITRFTIGGSDEGSLLDLLGDRGAAPMRQLLQGLTIGLVTNNKDAEESLKLNRVKVKFPYLSDTDESEWARVVVPGGGHSRGLMQLPEQDDEVLVGFENGDRNKPVVLGGLWNGSDPPPVDSASPELLDGTKVASRQWVSRQGHRVALFDKHDDGEQILIELKDKKTFVKLVKDTGIVVNAKDQDIEITNDKSSIKLASNGDITIKGAKITIEGTGDISVEGVNVKATGKANMNLEGKAQFTAKGGGKVGIESSGMTEIKGTLVKVN